MNDFKKVFHYFFFLKTIPIKLVAARKDIINSALFLPHFFFSSCGFSSFTSSYFKTSDVILKLSPSFVCPSKTSVNSYTFLVKSKSLNL